MKHHYSKGASLALVAGMYVVALGFGVRAFAWAVAMTDLFLFISIPMMERRQLARKPEYAAYRKRTRLFI